MNKPQKKLGFFFIALILAVNFVVATRLKADQSINARVTGVDAENRSLTVSPLDAKQDLPSVFTVSVNQNTELKGISSLDSLETGDEIVFEGNKTREKVWEAKRLEAVHTSTAAKAATAIENVKQNIKGWWYSVRYDLHTDRKTYENYADQRVKQLEDRLNQVQGNAKTKNISNQDIQFQLNATQQKLETLKNAQVEDNWKKAKSEFESSADKTESMLFDAADSALTEKERTLWRAEDTMTQLRYNIDELKAEIAKPEQQKPNVQKDLNNLEDRFKEAEIQLNNLRQAKAGNDWDLAKQDFQSKTNAAKAAYYDALAKFGA